MAPSSEERVCESPGVRSTQAETGDTEIDDQDARAYIDSFEERLNEIGIHKTVWYGKFGTDYFTSATGRISRYYYELGYVKLNDAWRICYRFRSDELDESLKRESSTAQDVAPLIDAPWYVRGEMIRCVDCLASVVLSIV
ncbi:MAG: hypothetical protein HZB26_15065 [Candidatus Hydrogenedentes bacterium]|nr:hypothetical protein [Candidatus Hydrogenedentota bacterium]